MKKIIVVLLVFLSGCSAMSIESYQDSSPRFILADYFLGHTRAWGIFQGRNGQVERQFTVDILGEMKGKTLILTEDFIYSDGEVDQRIWAIKKIDDHTYEGFAADVIGKAIGKTYGNALNWKYTLDLPYKDGTVKVKFDDWMFLQEDGVLINKAKMSKFGVHLGDVTLFFQRK
jgi:hypothetical protein